MAGFAADPAERGGQHGAPAGEGHRALPYDLGLSPAGLKVLIQVREIPRKESDGLPPPRAGFTGRPSLEGPILVSQTSALGISPCPIGLLLPS